MMYKEETKNKNSHTVSDTQYIFCHCITKFAHHCTISLYAICARCFTLFSTFFYFHCFFFFIRRSFFFSLFVFLRWRSQKSRWRHRMERVNPALKENQAYGTSREQLIGRIFHRRTIRFDRWKEISCQPERR